LQRCVSRGSCSAFCVVHTLGLLNACVKLGRQKWQQKVNDELLLRTYSDDAILRKTLAVCSKRKALHLSARGVTTDPGSIPGCITTGRDRESHRAVQNWASVAWVRGGFGRGMPSL
jgi:hypothetical protein